MTDASVTVTAEEGLCYLAVWELSSANPAGVALSIPGASDRTVQMTGTFNSATIVMQISLDGGTTWFTAKDPNGNAVSMSSAGGVAIVENGLLIRPSSSGGGGTQDVKVYLLSRSTMR